MSNSSVWSEVRPATLASLLRSRAAEHGERTAFVFLADGEVEGDRLTYRDLDRRARAIAAALRESLAPGDRALLLYPPGLEFIAAFFGCLYAGVIAVPAYPPRPNDRSQGRLRAIARDAEPRAALTTGALLTALSAVQPSGPPSGRLPELAAVRWIPTDALEGSDAEIPEPDPASVAFLQYTSGSTATPKGVMVTHANLLHNERMIGEAFQMDEASVVVGWLPLYHDMGLIGNVLQPLHAGGSCVLMAPVAFLQKPLRWLEAIGRWRGTTSGGPNFAYELCLRKVGEEQKAGLDLSSWRLAYNGAEPVRAETLERFAEAFAPCGFRPESFYPCYGLAEATLFVSGGEASAVPRVGTDEEDRRLVSCGRAWAEQRIAVADPESSTELPAGRVGEIWIAGPSVARGYWRNPEATERDFQAHLATGEGPFLRTGDLGFLRDGELYVTGRIKDLVIIRGRNHYPQDIELTAERSHPDLRPGSGAAFSVEVAGEERLVVVQEVERRRREGFEEVAEAVRRAVAEEHEVQVQDVVLVRVGTVPKTSSGKIQRRACRSLYLGGELAVVGRSVLSSEIPATPDAAVVPSRASLAALEPEERRSVVERFLRERAAAAVGVPAQAIDPEKPLTGLGLDSLAAIELKAAVESALGVQVPLADLLEGAGTGELAAALLPGLEGEGGVDGPALRAGGAELGAQPLSFGQKALWFIERLAPEGGAYNVAVAARARGLDPAALRRALTALTLRHPALRSVFPLVNDEPVRRVLDHPDVDFAVEEAAGWSEARLAERLADEAYRPFDLARGPVLRVRAFERGDGEQVLLLAVHHIAVDFASLAVVARDLAALYREETGGAAAELDPLPFGYSDFVRWQGEMLTGPRGERLWGWWREALAGLPDLDLPTDRPRPPLQTYRGGARTLELPAGLSMGSTEGLRALAAEQGATLYMVLLAAFQAQLARYAGQEDFAVGSPAAGRTPELAGAVGYFVSPVALRARLAGEPAFPELLARTRATVLAGLEHGDFPFALLAERLRPARDPARTPLFQVMFLLQRDRQGNNRPGDAPGIATFALGEAGGRLDLGGVELESLRLEERRAQFDLTLRAAEEAGGRLRVSLEFNADLFDAATAERMLGHLGTLLAGAMEHPERPVFELPLLTPTEREQALIAWNSHAADRRAEHRQDVLLHGLFEEQAARTPGAEAVVAGTERLTYAELNRRAEELARQLRAMGVGPETRVGVRLGRSARLIVSLLGVLKAGGAYVPLDPRYPQERLALMQEDSGARLVLDEDWQGGPPREAGEVRSGPAPGNLAYLIYTSGSTGRPKAVAITHRSAAQMVQWAGGVFGRAELAGVLASTSVAFDLSVFEIFVPLAWGGRVILAENALELPGLPAADEVTLVNTVPSALAELVRSGGLPAAVRTVNLAGEPIPPSLADAVHALPGGVRLYNLYGPSEDTTYSTWTLIAPGSDVTIGRPINDTRAYVLDPHQEPVPINVPGELYLGGAGLARGYLDRPELTAERFVPDPFSAGERLYRTGDLVRRRADGDLDFLGRIDHQVKIRGFRVELGEVEAALAGHPAVREAVVLALPEPGGGQRLAAYVVAKEGGAEPSVLRAHLKGLLPDAFVPTGWKVLEALPLSPNGKVDRKALARLTPEAEGSSSGADAEPSTPIERELTALVAEALGVAHVGRNDDFFALGGHSLLAARVASRASRLFGVDLPVSVLFQAPTVGALAARISERAGGAAVAPPVVPVLRPHEGREDLPLSFAQQRLWFLDRLQPGGAAYNMPGAAELVGALDVAALTAAFAEVVRRHEALRTRFVVQGGHPVQVIDPPAPVALETVDLGGLPEEEREAASGALMEVEAARPFDLAHGPLLRALLLRLGAERHRLLLTLHHMVADGWSLGVLLDELAALYGAFAAGRPSPLPELPVQYADFVVWQRHWLEGETLEKQLLWWKTQLAGAPTTLELPADRPRPAARTQRGGLVRSWLPGELAAGVRELARQQGATPFMALLAAFQTLLLRVTGQEDLLVGSAVAGRTRPEVEGLIGFFANTLVLRGALAGDPTFLEALEQARERTTGAWAHQDLPVERLVEELQPGRELGLTPLFQVVLVLQSAPAALALPGLEVRRLPVASGTAKFDLTLELTEQEDGLAAAWELSRDLFEDSTVERLAGWFARLLAGAVEAPERRLSDLPLLGEAEVRQLLAERNPAPTAAPVDVPVHRLFEEQVALGPARVALVQGGREITYGELNAWANRVARRLDPHPLAPSPTRTHSRPGEGGPEPLVGVLLERSIEMVVAFLAVLKAGGAYVPLDPSWPRERLAALIEEAGIQTVLTEEWFRHPMDGSAENLPGPDAGRLAYAMFTSGSTGRPKTVGVEHRSIVRLVRDTDFMDFGPDQVFLQLAAPAFDAATLEIWGALLHGARLVLPPPGPASLDELGKLLEGHGVTTLWLTAGLFHQVVESRIQLLRPLRQLLAGGDVLSPAAVNRVLSELPGLRMINGYGPTENTTFTLCHTVAEPVPPGRTVPVGRPIPGTQAYIVDRALQPVPDLVPGELLAGGEGLARGYLGRPDLTAERFIPSPFGDGERLYRTGDLVRSFPGGPIEFLGRIDRQVKIRGFRVEPGEIESTLTGHPAVAQAAVLIHEPSPEDRRLLAFVTGPRPGSDLAELRAWLADRLPAYLIPVLLAIPELPLTPNGKVDRAALERFVAESTGSAAEGETFEAPRTPVEELIAGIWAEVLGLARVGIHDDFFSLGGHSLLATRAVSRIVDTLHVDLPLSTFFEAPTVAGLAERLFGASSRSGAPPLVPVPRDQPLPLSFAQQRLWFLDRLAPGGSAYNIAVAALLEGDLDTAALERSLGEIVRRHEALRTVFAEADGRPVQIVLPWEAPALERRDLSGLPAANRLEAARQEAERDAARPFDLAAGPVVRFLLIALGPREHLLAATFHHIAADGWSLQVFLHELAELYGAFAAGRTPELPEPPVQYADYAVWQRKALSGPGLARSLAFWRWRLAGLEPVELPADGNRTSAATAPARTRPLDLPDELAVDVAAYAREAGATPFMVLLAGAFALLARLSGQRDLTVGAPVAARHRTEIEGLIGFFANTLPLRADLTGDPPFEELAARVRRVVLEAHAHGDVPLERLVEELQPERAAGRNPLFDVVLAYLSSPEGWTDLPGLALTPVDLPGAEAKFDLSFTVHERGGLLSGTVEGRGDLFEEATLGRVAAWYRTLLTGVLADPAAHLSDLPLLTGSERQALLAVGRTAGPSTEPLLIHELFAERARRAPDAPALEMEGRVFSYAELQARASRLARHLTALGVEREDRVAVALERSPELVVSLLATLAAGGAYVPIDPAYPQERIELLLADSGARVLVTGGSDGHLPEGLDTAGARLLRLEDLGEETPPASPVALDPRNLAYVLYTSGSTGRPKGVAVEHGVAAAHLRTAIRTYGLGPGERILFFASPSFDVALEQILLGLLAGATTVLRGPELWEPAGLARKIGELGLTYVNLPTAYWSRWVREAADQGAPESLRLVLVGGEEMPADSARLWRQSPLARVRLLNGYGPTETVITATLQEVGEGAVTIGRPLPGRSAHVLDPLDPGCSLLPAGAHGELALGGVVARGYLGAPDRTAERFVPDPFAEEPGARLYRTGDRVRRRADGELEFLGRIDTQLKIRGFRVEPGEIEAVLLAHPAVREAAVAAVPAAGGSRLAAWVAAKTGEAPAPAELRAFVSERLPAWMVPASYTLLAALPLTPHGKVDRRALPRPSLAVAEEGWTAPRNALEEALAAVWSQVLGVERVGAHDDFFHLGGHSLLATQLAARVRAVLGVELPLSELFEAPTLAGMAAHIEAARSAGEEAAPPLVRRPHPGAVAPLSFAQQRLWFLHQLEPDSPAYHVSGALRLLGPLRPEVLERALGEIVLRHEALRTVFLDTEAGPVQRILPPEPVPLPVVDVQGAADPQAEAERLGLEEARRLFDLAAGPVLRAQLLRLGPEEHLLVVVIHHIASDGWSLGVMIGELAALYAALSQGEPSPLPELPVQYADFAEWQRRTLRGRLLERQLVWWRQQLADPPVLDLPADHPRPPVPSGRGGHLPAALPAGLARDLQTLARGEGTTLYMVLLAAFATLLGRWSGQDDLTVGSPIANRDRQEIEPLIGCFVNTLTLRVRLAGDPTFRELLARVREVTLGAYDHQGVPFERLVEELAPGRDRAHSPLFQVLLVLQNAPLPPLRMGELVLERQELPTGTSKFDLTLALAEEGGGIAGTLEHSTDLFEAATAVRLLGHLAVLLRGAVDDPGRPLSALPLLTAGEREQILDAWNNGPWNDRAADFCEGPASLRLSDLVAAQAVRTPNAPAVLGWRLSGEDRLTYAELLARADRLAAHLVGLGVGPEARVGVCLDRTADLPVALLAVLRAGGAYVPLDPAYPRERLEFMLRDSGAGVLITQRDLAGRCGPFGGVTVWIEDAVPAAALGETGATPQNLAYLIYTSGSTGVPKAVAIEHRSAVTLVRWALGEYSAEELAGVLFSTSVCFDLSIFELFVPLSTGGRVVVAANALELPALPFAGEVTLVNTVPSALTELVRGDGFPASVRTINLAGEPLKGALVDAAYELPGVRRVLNLYGPSEDTTYSTWETVPAAPERPGEPLIGRPIAGTRVYLLDRGGHLVPEGVPGELFLAGAGLARGYLGRPALTAERFVPDPFSNRSEGGPGARLYRTGDLARWRSGGRIEYLGRIDHQVKVRGFRIELGEIEAALARHPAVGEAVVLARDEASRGQLLVAFLVRGPEMEGADLRPTELRRFLRRSLPEHMVPTAFVELPALPLTPNGKVDRRTLGRMRLDAAGASRQGEVAPRTPTEELLAALWCEVLGRDRVGVHDSFFELGGHSLLATRLVSRVRATFGRDLPLARLFDAPTIAELGRVLDEARGGVARAAPIRPVPREGDLPLSFAQERLWFLDRIQPGAAYNVPLALRLRGTLDAARLGAAFGSIVARHEALRTVFAERDGEPAQRILPPRAPESWPLPLIDLAAQPGGEATAARLAELDALRPFDLASGPLLRTTLLRLGATDHVLLLNMHHIVSDGWSLGVLLQELEAFYGGTPDALPELPVQYADFAVWQKDWLRGQELERQMAYWRQQLAGAPAVLDLPTDRPRPLIASSNGARRDLALDPGLTARLAEAARRQGATLFMLLLAAWAALLHRWSRQGDLNIGTPIAGRNRSEIEHLVGFFVNTLVLRTELADDPAFPELLARVRQTALAAYDHQDLPFEKLVDELRIERDMSHQPLFQVMFALQNAPLGALELPGLVLEPTELGATVAKFDLTLNLMELRGVMTGSLEYNTDLFDGTTAARLAGHLEVLLEGIAADPAGARVSELPLLTPGEWQQLTLEWTDARPEDPGCHLLHELVERQVDRIPEAPAVEFGEILWSFSELESRANRLAWYLRELGVGPETRVGLFVERCADMVAAMLGVLKAGGAYVPLDPAYPRERVAAMLQDDGMRVVLTQERLLDRLPATAPRAVCLDRDWEEIALRSDTRPAIGIDRHTPAYLIYTSGSTGMPKGVMVPHEAVCVYSQACSAVYGSGPGDRNLQFSSISFDASVEEIYSSLTRGATLVVRGEVQEGISEFLERCRDQRITLLQLPTAFWNQMVTAMETESLTLPEAVRVMFVGGEKMQAQRLISWWSRVHPAFKLINAYGPTETTVAATLCPIPGALEVHDGLREVPIGRPLSYVRAYVLDRGLRPVPIGVAGELCMGGPSLARGYLDRPDLTAEKFIPNPLAHLGGAPGERLYRTGDLVRLLPNGMLEFIGRTDHQVKLRGYRIELGEIETTLAAHPALGEVVVVLREDAPGDMRLVAFAAAKGETAPTTAELRIWLEERLPAYMVPSAIQVLPALPVSAHGKVDRRALERMAPQTRERAAFAAPRNELEETIAAVWREVFGLQDAEGADALGVHDNFFDAGGNSLLLVKLHSRLQKALERTFPLVEMFKHPTIAALAASLEAEAPAKPSLDKARARTETRRESMRQLQQLREQRRRGR